MSETPTKLETVRLAAWYGPKQVLSDLDLKIPGHQVTAILGPSGGGKTTLIRCLNRMHELVPKARMDGVIRLDGQDIHAGYVDPVAIRRRVGMIADRPNPFPNMSIRQNVLAGQRLAGIVPRDSPESTLEYALRSAGLWDVAKDHLDDPGTSLDVGRQQQLCIARALAVEPEVLLLDDPCTMLDPGATTRIENIVDELRDRYTIVLATHDTHLAARVSQSTAFLAQGTIIEFSASDTLFTSPSDPRTEDYITGKFG